MRGEGGGGACVYVVCGVVACVRVCVRRWVWV